MNKTAFLLVLVMATLVLFAGCINTNSPPPSAGNGPGTEPAPAQEAPVAETPEPEPRAAEVDYSIAGQIERCGGDETCLTAVALEYESPAICEGFGWYTDAYDICYIQLAVKYKNAGYCNELLGSERNECTGAVEAALSSQIAASGTTAETISPAARNYTISEQIDMCKEKEYLFEEDNCLEALALTYEIPSLCNEVSPLLECYEQMAIKFNKPQYCQDSDCRKLFE